MSKEDIRNAVVAIHNNAASGQTRYISVDDFSKLIASTVAEKLNTSAYSKEQLDRLPHNTNVSLIDVLANFENEETQD